MVNVDDPTLLTQKGLLGEMRNPFNKPNCLGPLETKLEGKHVCVEECFITKEASDVDIASDVKTNGIH